MQAPRPKRKRAGNPSQPPDPESPSAEHQTLGDKLYGELRTRDLALKAASAFVLGATALVFEIGVPAFILLYALQVGFAMFVTAPMMFVADRRDTFEGASVHYVAAIVTAMVGFWAVAVLLPLWSLWGSVGQDAEGMRWSALPWAEMSLPVLGFLATSIASGRRYARLPAAQRAQISLHRPVVERALCIIAFILFGPTVYNGLLGFGEIWPAFAEPVNAVILTYALAEAYPFLATLIDRMLARRRRPE